MMKRQKSYDKKVKLTRILLSDYLVLKRMSIAAGLSMSEALHRLIEHQAQLPLLDMQVKPAPAAQVTGIPMPTFRVAPVTSIAVNGAGAKHSVFKIKPRGGVVHD